MIATNVLVDGEWYILLFSKMAKFLVDETRYEVYLASYDSPLKRVTVKNFEELNKKVEEGQGKDGDIFVLKLTLPELEIKTISGNNSKVSINSSYLGAHSILAKIDNDLYRRLWK